uniref:Ig-like domain-containing protein n=1 Tax=Mustela putorius furo TaxID=9669 RepID=M3Y7G4_MUSPF
MQSRLPAVLCTVVAFIHFGSSNADNVRQSASVHEEEGKSVTLDCSFTLNFNYYVMCWYHQPPNGKMTEIISMFSDSSTNMEGRYTLSLQKRSRILKLTITGLMLADTGVYFCAIGENLHSEKSDREGLTKTPWAQHETATCSRSIGE